MNTNNANKSNKNLENVVYPELSYKLVGLLYKVYNFLGGGYQEKYYQAAVRKELLTTNIPFLEQVKADLIYRSNVIGRYYLDFIIDHRIVLELKTAPVFAKRDIIQVLNYLKQSNLKLGVLVSFNRQNLTFKRILRGK